MSDLEIYITGVILAMIMIAFETVYSEDIEEIKAEEEVDDIIAGMLVIVCLSWLTVIITTTVWIARYWKRTRDENNNNTSK